MDATILLKNSTLRKIVNVNLLINSWCIYKLKSVHVKQNQKKKKKIHMKAINRACLRLEEKATRSVKMNKNYFINIIGDKCIECTK